MGMDYESTISSEVFRSTAQANWITLQLSGFERENSLSSGERYHAPLLRVFPFLRSRHPVVHPETFLTLIQKGINDSIELSGLVPMVFRVLSSFPVTSATYPIQDERMKALTTARDEITAIHAESWLVATLSSKLPPATIQIIDAGGMIRAYRETAARWEGPFKVEITAGKQVCPADDKGRKT